jgi:hypothetical protein
MHPPAPAGARLRHASDHHRGRSAPRWNGADGADGPDPRRTIGAGDVGRGLAVEYGHDDDDEGLVTTVLARQTAPAADPMELALKLFALVEKRSGGASPEAEAPKDGWEGVASAMVKPIGEAIGQQIRSGMVGGPAAPATQPAPAARQISPSSAPVAAAAPSAPAVADAQAALWTAVQTVLLRGAVNEGDPNAYSDVLLDLIGEDSARELLTAHPGAAVIDFLTAQLPAMAEYVQWLSTVVHAMRLDLELYDPPAPVAPTHNNGVARADAGDPQPVRPGG